MSLRLRLRYDLDDIQRLAIVAALVLFIAFLAAVWPFWFGIPVMGEGLR